MEQKVVIDSASTRAARAYLNVTLADMAQHLGVSVSTYHRWENGQPVTQAIAQAIADRLKTAAPLGRQRSSYRLASKLLP